jgi:hypothetical protein
MSSPASPSTAAAKLPAPSTATSKRPAQARADDAKRHVGGDHPDDAKFAIRDDAGRILAYYSDARRADAALRRYEVVDCSAAPAAAPKPLPRSHAGIHYSPHHVSCCFRGTMYDRTVGCIHCDRAEQHELDCKGDFKQYTMAIHGGPTTPCLRCTTCGFEL